MIQGQYYYIPQSANKGYQIYRIVTINSKILVARPADEPIYYNQQKVTQRVHYLNRFLFSPKSNGHG